jgi:serine/threonine-protein kinase
MGEVYRARDPRLGRNVAIKVAHEQFSDRFQREARAVAALNHPNICTLYDVGPNYLVMEYIEGTPLKGPFSSEKAREIALQITSALVEAHRKGVIHRDLKPANILLTATGVKLLDFGLAKWEQPAGDDDSTAWRTEAGAVLGTAGYMSPEQASGKPGDARSDIFSLGSVLYEMLSGQRAFQGDTAVAVVAAVLHKEPASLHAPPELVRIVTRCLRKAPGERFQNAADLKAALAGETVLSTAQPSIAVLPFANLSADKDNEYFSDGLTEEIINVLAHIRGLKVIARTSAFVFRGREQDIRHIADSLNVRTILQGSVRQSGSRIRVNAQLIDAEDGSHLWSERYDREVVDVFAVQDEIAQAIATVLEMKLATGSSALRHYAPKLPSYDAYLKARHYHSQLTPESMKRARESLEQAIALDPGFALPHAELGVYFVDLATFGMMPALESLPLARASAQRALECDPSLPEALTVLGVVAGAYDHDWKEAERRFQLALAREPVAPVVHQYYGISHLYFVGRPLDAAREVALSLESDPLNSLWRQALAFCHMAAGKDAEATTELRRLLEFDEDFHLAYSHLGVIEASRGLLTEALSLIEMAYKMAPWLTGNSGLLAGLLLRTGGDSSRAAATLHSLGDGSAYGGPMGFLLFHLVCGEFDKAADWAEAGIAQRDPAIMYFLQGPLARGLRSSGRWPGLARSLNLPETAVQVV